MKRSEALDLIDEVLYEHECPLLSAISKEILSKLERAGMKPPSYTAWVTETRVPLNGVTVSKILQEWEPENET